MEKLVVFLMTLPFFLIILFQPALDRVEEANEKVVQVAIQRAVERAAIEGHFTDENLKNMYKILESIGVKKEDVIFEGTTELTYRGDYIEGSLKVPNRYQFILIENIINGELEEKYHYHAASRMSEFIN